MMELDEVYTVRTIKRDPKDRELKFETALEHLCTLKSLENVSYMLSQINFSQLEPITEISVFKKGIMPLWEDPANSNGAQWNLKFSNDISERIFQKFLISFITTKFESLDINGIVYIFLSVYYFKTIAFFQSKKINTPRINIRQVISQ